MGKRKDSVSLNARIGAELFDTLDEFCRRTGQPKTVAVERALRSYCGESVSGTVFEEGTADEGD